ncbi:MAG: efflux RND transporter periplasmic adaptor subunit, partial [Rhizobiales bacterium]|nr:efflux RND transporter periplasmic adaptor subunit [Hyphomicrobiales bacterium]
MPPAPLALRSVIGVVLCGWALSGCSDATTTASAEAEPVPQQVSVVTVQPSPLPLIRELPGRIAPTRIAEIRARVTGIVVSRNFEQGSDVDLGDVLYRLDSEPFEIELKAADAALAKAEAVFKQATQNARRMEALAPSRAVAQSQVDIAVAELHQAQADVAARKADVARARVNLDHTVIRAPISGRIGRALVTEGALVGQGDFTHVATIQRLDPIYADFTQSVAELNQLRRDFENGELDHVSPGGAKVRLILDNGEVYPFHGKLLFSDTTVDPSTGQVTLRGEFPNPKHELLPGMYVRVQIEQGIDPDALAVPQQAVRRDDAGASELFVVRNDNRAVVRQVRLGRVVHDRWMVLEGIKPG